MYYSVGWIILLRQTFFCVFEDFLAELIERVLSLYPNCLIHNIRDALFSCAAIASCSSVGVGEFCGFDKFYFGYRYDDELPDAFANFVD